MNQLTSTTLLEFASGGFRKRHPFSGFPLGKAFAARVCAIVPKYSGRAIRKSGWRLALTSCGRGANLDLIFKQEKRRASALSRRAGDEI
jgi:hypothetical protein